MNTAIVWLRQDLRLSDNPALHHALRHHDRVILTYIHAPEEAAPWQPGGAKRWWLHHSLAALQESVTQLGGRLLLRHGPSLEALLQLIDESGATAVYWNRVYEPALIKRDTLIKQVLKERHLLCQSFNGNLLYVPGSVMTQGGQPYRVFTPFWRECQKQGFGAAPLPAPETLHPTSVESQPLASLQLLPKIPWDQGLKETWQPGEAQAQHLLQQFCEEALNGYPQQRDIPAVPGTSRLSPYLANGEISPRQIVAALMSHFIGNSGSAANIEHFIRELGWREFAYHTLYHTPHTCDAPLDERYQNFPWREDAALLRAWQRGETRIPLVDAGMRQLWQTGWMHNRVRMVVAAFLTKNGMIDWRHGARWFWDTLVDADLASNTLNWQWAAGCGADAAPYFRVFNPVRQSERFDAEGGYLRRWLPELRQLNDKQIHQPWKSGGHPPPIVNLEQSRREVIAAAKTLLGSAASRQPLADDQESAC